MTNKATKLNYVEATKYSNENSADRISYSPSSYKDNYSLIELGVINRHSVLAGKEVFKNGKTLIWIQNGISLVGAVLL